MVAGKGISRGNKLATLINVIILLIADGHAFTFRVSTFPTISHPLVLTTNRRLSPLMPPAQSQSGSSKTRLGLNPKETSLQDQLIRNPPNPFTKLYKREWHVVPKQSHHGVGDLVFQKPGTKQFLVVETKYLRIDPGRAGKRNRNSGRKRVREQIEFYSRQFKNLHPNSKVESAIYTNLEGLQYIKTQTKTEDENTIIVFGLTLTLRAFWNQD